MQAMNKLVSPRCCWISELPAHGGSWLGPSPRRPHLLQRKACIYMFVFTTNISLSHCLQHIAICVHFKTVTSVLKSRSFFVSDEHVMLWVGIEYNSGGG